ncbi:CheR family methyltransferase [Magnetococcus sp. PR-3]|uniref:CheR family methyltransferase n=1 Tax=Magnetococcus sp. PR-3 TaxID=3120355 RepID=UPI002FCE35E4
MSLSVEQLPHGQKQINVLGKIDPELETALLVALEAPCSGPMEIIFYDAPTLTVAILKALVILQAQAHGVVIIAYHPNLVQDLHRLGLPCRFKGMIRKDHQPSPIQALAIGGSTDSLDKLLNIVALLPVSQCVLFVIQHICEDRLSYLDQLLQSRTDYRMVVPHHLSPLEPGTIYVAPPGLNMRVAHGLIYVTEDAKQDYARPSIGVLFESLAREFGPKLLAALLCGEGRDGVDAMGLIKQLGGLALVEQGSDCSATSMVESAVVEEKFSLVLSWQEIASFFAAAAQPELPASSALIDTFLQGVESRYGYAFKNYAPGTLQRRVQKIISESGMDNFFHFQKEVLTKTGCFERLFQAFSIGVTHFFRHPEQLDHLQTYHFPYLQSFPHLRIWVAGCATGETCYSLAILLHEAGLLPRTQIYATDINPIFLQQARNGLYPLSGLSEASQNYQFSGGRYHFENYIHQHGPFYAMDPMLQDKILFCQHSLANDGVFNTFQLILCSNVIIYFNRTLQTEVMDLFSRSLHKDGLLMLGPKEGLSGGDGERHFKAENAKMRIYRLKL